MNLVDAILRHARYQPAVAALIDEDRTITYGELAGLVLRTAGHLTKLGVRRGDYVGLCLKDNWHHVVTLLAIARLGGIVVQVDPRARFAEKAAIETAFPYKLVLIAQDADVDVNHPTVALDSAWDRAVAQAMPPASLPNDWNDPIVVQATAGTTGISKFTIATHLQFYFRLTSYREAMPAIRSHRYLACLPLFYSFGRNVCLLNLLYGGTLIFHPMIFSAAEFVDAAIRSRATMAAIVRFSVRQLLAAANSEQSVLPGLELLLSAGAPLFADEKRKIVQKLTPNFYEVYAASALGPISMFAASGH